MTRPLHICITGLDGTGKTTQVGRLAERIERQAERKTAIVTIWDLLLHPRTGGRIGFKSPAQVDTYLGTISNRSRHLFFLHCFAEAMALAAEKEPQVLISNAYWFKYFATECAHGADGEAALAAAEACFQEPDLVVQLTLSSKDAFSRKANLSGYECGFSESKSEADFIAFQERASAAMERIAASRGWVAIDGSASTDAVTDAIWKRAQELVQ